MWSTGFCQKSIKSIYQLLNKWPVTQRNAVLLCPVCCDETIANLDRLLTGPRPSLRNFAGPIVEKFVKPSISFDLIDDSTVFKISISMFKYSRQWNFTSCRSNLPQWILICPTIKKRLLGLYLKERQIWGQRETATRSIDTKEKVHKSVQVSEVSASRS